MSEGWVTYAHGIFSRFTEALEPLEEGLALVKKLGDDLASYRWPGSQVVMEETKAGKLLVNLIFNCYLTQQGFQ